MIANGEVTYIITDDAANVIAYDNDGFTIEFPDESYALNRAKKELKLIGYDNEIWVWKLSHVLSKESEITVESVG